MQSSRFIFVSLFCLLSKFLFSVKLTITDSPSYFQCKVLRLCDALQLDRKHHHHSCFLSPSALFTSLIIYTQCFDLKISILIHSDIHRQCYTFFQFIGRDMFELSLMFIMICAITLPLNDCAIWDKITRHFDEFLYKTSTFFNYLDILLTFIFKRKYVWHYLKINKYKKINNSLKYGTLDSLCTVASRIVVKRNDTSAGKSLTSIQNMLT